MFLLCTLALAGTEDQLVQAKGKREVWETLTWSGRLELRVRTRRVCAQVLGVGYADASHGISSKREESPIL